MKKSKHSKGNYGKAISKILPGDHIHYVAPEPYIGEFDIDDIMIKAENKQKRKQEKRLRDARGKGKI
jgi:hypothetical protein